MIIKVNGIDLFYKKAGNGKPFILLHGNGESHEIFNGLIDKLVEDYTVYAIDSRGHGKSSKVDKIGYGDMMQDVAAFIMESGLEKPVLLGFSDGAILGLLLASQYPNMLSSLISCGANTHPGQLKKWFIALAKFGYFSTKDPKMKMMYTEPNISKDDLAKIRVPALIVAGSRDILPERYTKEIAKSIPNSECLILHGETHSSYIKHSEKIYKVLTPFLSKSPVY